MNIKCVIICTNVRVLYIYNHMAVCRLRLAQGSVKYGGHLIDFPGAPARLDPSGRQNIQNIHFLFLLSKMLAPKCNKILTPTLDFLHKYMFFKNVPPPLGTLKYRPQDQLNLIFFIMFEKCSIRCPRKSLRISL